MGVATFRDLNEETINACWQYLSSRYVRFVNEDGTVTDEWEKIQNARFRNDADVLRTTLAATSPNGVYWR